MTTEVIAVDQVQRRIVVRHMPSSQRDLIDALLKFWTANEMPFSITEVLRYEKPQRVFYAVRWIEGEKE